MARLMLYEVVMAMGALWQNMQLFYWQKMKKITFF